MAELDNNSVARVPVVAGAIAPERRFLEDIQDLARTAKTNGVRRPYTILKRFLDEQSKLDVQLFGLKCGIVFTFMSPIGLYWLKYHCLTHHVPLDLPETDIMKFCLFNIGSVMAFGFGSGIVSVLDALKPNDAMDGEP